MRLCLAAKTSMLQIVVLSLLSYKQTISVII
jgi:hypothetical protein